MADRSSLRRPRNGGRGGDQQPPSPLQPLADAPGPSGLHHLPPPPPLPSAPPPSKAPKAPGSASSHKAPGSASRAQPAASGPGPAKKAKSRKRQTKAKSKAKAASVAPPPKPLPTPPLPSGKPGSGRAETVLCNDVVARRIFKAVGDLSQSLVLSRLVSRRMSRAYGMRKLRELNIPDSETEAQRVTQFMFREAPLMMKVKGAARLSEVAGFGRLRHVELQLKEAREWAELEGFLSRNRETLRTLVLFITEDLNVGRAGYANLPRRHPREYLASAGNLPNLRSLRIVHDFDAGKFNVDAEVFESLLRIPSPSQLRALAFADFDIRGEAKAKGAEPPRLELAMAKLAGLRVVVDPSLNMLRRHHTQWAQTVHCLDIKLLDFGVTVPYVEPMAARLTSFTIYLHLPRDSRSFVKLMSSMPSLGLLTLNVYFTNPEETQHWPRLDRAALPRLRHLKIFTFQELDGRAFSAWFNGTFAHSVRRLDVESALQRQDFQLDIRTPLKRLGVLLNNDEVDPDSFSVRLHPSDALRQSLRLLTLDGPLLSALEGQRRGGPGLVLRPPPPLRRPPPEPPPPHPGRFVALGSRRTTTRWTRTRSPSASTPPTPSARASASSPWTVRCSGLSKDNDEVDPDSFSVRLHPSDALRQSLRLLTLDGSLLSALEGQRRGGPGLVLRPPPPLRRPPPEPPPPHPGRFVALGSRRTTTRWTRTRSPSASTPPTPSARASASSPWTVRCSGLSKDNDEVDPDSFSVRLHPSDALRQSLRLLTLDGPYAAFRNVERGHFRGLERVELVWSKKGKEKIEDHLRWLSEEQKRIATRKRKLEQLLGTSAH